MEVETQIKVFKEFIQGTLISQLKKNIQKDQRLVEIDFNSLAMYSPDFADEILEKPQEALTVAQIAIDDIDGDFKGVKARFYDLPKSSHKLIGDIRTEHIGKFLSVEGQVKGIGSVVGKVTHTKYECPSCGNIIRTLQPEKMLKEPSACGCGRRGKFRMIDKEVIDAFTLLLEEAPELSENPNLAEIKILFTHDLVLPRIYSRLSDGVRVRITGMVIEQFKKTKMGTENELTWYIDANHLKIYDEDYSSIEITKADKEKITEYSKRPDLLENLSEQIFCDLAGLKYEKQILTLISVGGVKFKKERGQERGDMHALLVGDPSMGKTKIIKALRRIIPKSRYVSGGSGTSQVGLGGGVIRDEILGRFILVAGALPLSHKGVCIIDELDGLSKEDVKALNEATGEQEVTITKIAKGKFKAECSVLFIANPENGRVDDGMPLLRQIKISPTLLSRCDAIMLFQDKVDAERDASIMDVMFGLSESEEVLSTDFLRKYISYARKIEPTITVEARIFLRDNYVNIRQKMTNSELKNIPITPREGYSMLRLATACAKIKLKNKVELAEAKQAVALKMYCLMQTAFDKETGTLDTIGLYTGTTISERSIQKMIEHYLDTNEVIGQNGHEVDAIYAELNKEGKIDSRTFESTIAKMSQDGLIFEPIRGRIMRLD